ncbi:unnamed protein product [Prorocentrum cordatum]|uniref:Uncharacterized protein n=1 Tax=Prorocentrum cordatum TaxID=2364126 RepID=A0ABN9WDY0_9DINO|nr:unnamed protein product [Polarella glacialis]
MQWISRLEVAIDERLGGTQDAETRAQIVIMKKTVQVISSLCKTAKKHGAESDEFLAEAKNQMAFVDMDPKIEVSVFPGFVKLAAKRFSVLGAAGADFWQSLSVDNLAEVTVTIAETRKLQRELLCSKVEPAQENATTCRASLLSIFQEAYFCNAELSADTLVEVESISNVIKASSTSSIGAAPLDKLGAAVELVADKSAEVASSLLLFPPGKLLHQQALKTRDATKASDLALSRVEVESGKLGGLDKLGERGWTAHSEDLERVAPAVKSLVGAVEALTSVDYGRADKDIKGDFMEQFFWGSMRYWSGVALGQAFAFVLRVADDHDKMDGDLMECIVGIAIAAHCTNVGGAVCDSKHDSLKPALKQIISLLPCVAKVVALKQAETLNTGEAIKLQAALCDFSMDAAWADEAAIATATLESDGSQSEPSSNTAKEIAAAFGTAVKERLFDLRLRKSIFMSVVAEKKLADSVKAFVDQVPEEYKTNAFPREFKELQLGDLTSLAAGVGDRRLVKQLSLMKAAHATGMALHAVAQARGEGLQIAELSGSAPVCDDTAKLITSARARLQTLVATVVEPDLFEKREDEDNHLDAFDQFLGDPMSFKEFVVGSAMRELDIWRNAWTACVHQICNSIESSIEPPGILALKDSILKPEHSEKHAALVGNKNYKVLSESVNALKEARRVARSVAKDAFGPFLAADVVSKSKQVFDNGIEVVSLTYAVFQVTAVIPKIKGQKKRKDAVDALKADILAKGVKMSESILEECARLETSAA